MMRKASMDVINWLNCIWSTNLPSNSKYLACYLRKFMNSNSDIAYPSYSRIIAETGLARSTVAKYLKILEDEGWIQRDSGSKGINTVYIASLPKDIGQTVKEFDDKIQEQLKGSTRDELGSTSHEPEVVRETNTNKQCNKQLNKQPTPTQFSGKQKTESDFYFIDSLSRVDYRKCHIAMEVMRHLKDDGVKNLYHGCLKIEDWNANEEKLNDLYNSDSNDTGLSELAFFYELLKNIYKKRDLVNRDGELNLTFLIDGYNKSMDESVMLGADYCDFLDFMDSL